MTTILAVDLSLAATGVAWWRSTNPDGQRVFTATIKTQPDGIPPARHARIVGELYALHPDMVVVEGRIMPTNSGDKGTGRSNNALDLAELRGVFMYGLHARTVPAAQVHTAHLKKFATGRHTAPKEEVLLSAERRLGAAIAPATVANNNEADAVWLLAMALHHYGRPLCDLPVVQTTVLDKVQWPDWRP